MGEPARACGGVAVHWPAPAGVGARMSCRYPGESVGRFAGLNLGDHVGDDPLAVARNRLRWAGMLEGSSPVFLRQVHGTRCVRLPLQSAAGLQADAATTRQPGVACTVLVADCLPVLLCDARGAQVAAAHAGWRGLLHGVLAEAVAAFEAPPAALLAWLGPCIGPRAFEVGPEVRAAFVAQWGQEVGEQPWFTPRADGSGKWWCDLAGLARWQLQRLGVRGIWGNDGGELWCTWSNAQAWFSHRREGSPHGGTGRMAASVWLRPRG